MFFIECSLQQRMSQDYDHDLGKVKYSITERENHRIITIPQDSDTLIFVMDKKGELLPKVNGLLDAIRHVRTWNKPEKSVMI